MPRPPNGCRVVERGIEGWHDVVEVVSPPDTLRVGGTLCWFSMTWRVVSVARRTRPEHPDGVCLLLALHERHE